METTKAAGRAIEDIGELSSIVHDVVRNTEVIDIHTHLFPAEFRKLNSFGVDHLLTYHYLVAEYFRYSDVAPRTFFALSVPEQAELIYQAMFVENTPVSEASVGVMTVMKAFGTDSSAPLSELREFFGSQAPRVHVDRVFSLAGVRSIVMTNDPFDDIEISEWQLNPSVDPRFLPALRMDRLLNNWPETCAYLTSKEIDISPQFGERSIAEVLSYLRKAVERLQPLYLAASLPDSFKYPCGDVRNKLIEEVMLPLAREYGLPVMVMIGVRRGVNLSLGPAGDGVGRADVASVERLCSANPDLKFFATFLSRENQHELCVSARKFANLMPFGCWWFLNNPSIISEIISERLELLGTSFIPQHSDARVLEQLVYKWAHSREIIAECLTDSYRRVIRAGYPLDRLRIEHDVENLFQNNFKRWVSMPNESIGTREANNTICYE